MFAHGTRQRKARSRQGESAHSVNRGGMSNIISHSSRDTVVHLWNVPEARPPSTQIPPKIGPPLTLACSSKSEQGDLTSLDWTQDGSLLAIGSYDAILRVCTAGGELYFSHTQHEVGVPAVTWATTRLRCRELLMRRDPYSPRAFRKTDSGYSPRVWTARRVSGTSRRRHYIDNSIATKVGKIFA